LQPVQLTSTELKSLLRLVQAHRTPQAIARRARIILGAQSHPGWSSQQLAQLLQLNDRLRRKWRQRWQESHSLKDAPRSGAPRRFPSPVRAQVTALACSLPRSSGVPLARWSRAELARQVASTPTLPAISAGTIGRWLAEEQIPPWRYHSWQHIQNPEAFLSRARPVLRLYEQATALMEQGIWVVCTDEKTCIQAQEAQPRSSSSQIFPSPLSISTLPSAWRATSSGGFKCRRWAGLCSVLPAQTLPRFSLLLRDGCRSRSPPPGSTSGRFGPRSWSDPRPQATATLGQRIGEEVREQTDHATLLASY
jgi:transposase-like protein